MTSSSASTRPQGTSRTAWFLGLAARELDETAPRPGTPLAASPAGQRSIGPGTPSPGALCM
jgi:hypothetical protein